VRRVSGLSSPRRSCWSPTAWFGTDLRRPEKRTSQSARVIFTLQSRSGSHSGRKQDFNGKETGCHPSEIKSLASPYDVDLVPVAYTSASVFGRHFVPIGAMLDWVAKHDAVVLLINSENWHRCGVEFKRITRAESSDSSFEACGSMSIQVREFLPRSPPPRWDSSAVAVPPPVRQWESAW
jgi:hypothetical protein